VPQSSQDVDGAMPVHTLSLRFCLKLLKHDPQMNLAQRPKELADCVRRSSLEETEIITGNLRVVL
jgi:hypothetical protein